MLCKRENAQAERRCREEKRDQEGGNNQLAPIAQAEAERIVWGEESAWVSGNQRRKYQWRHAMISRLRHNRARSARQCKSRACEKSLAELLAFPSDAVKR